MKPILFSTSMVQAILDGRKTQTRRVIKDGANRTPQNIGREKFFKMVNALNNKPFFGAGFYKDSDVFEYKGEILTDAVYFKCPYKPGDVLWVREAWCKNENPNSPNYGGYEYYADYEGAHCQSLIKWRSPIFMPREAARLFLKVKTVRVEKLQAITAHDAIREGMESVIPFDTLDEFKELWDNLNAKRGYGWETNPWVWVYEFEKFNKE
jgi:hypothetical protein